MTGTKIIPPVNDSLGKTLPCENKKSPLEMQYHIPVMLHETLGLLDVKPDGVYVDCTLGGGGHSEKILKKLTTGTLVGIDRDGEAYDFAKSRLGKYPNFWAVKDSFHNFPAIMEQLGFSVIDGVLLDLGVSSHQIDSPERGFSYTKEGPLDMRMDTESKITAAHIVNTYSEKKLAALLFELGEERQAKKIARLVCNERVIKKIETTTQLVSLVEKCVFSKGNHPAMRTFMALRIAVNNELEPLAATIRSIISFLTKGGRIVTITFHSLEDRIVKNVFREAENPCVCPRDIPFCACKKKPLLKNITKKPLLPTKSEICENPRASSAKLRGACRI